MTGGDLPMSTLEFLEQTEGEGEWQLCMNDFPRFANVAGRILQEHLGEDFDPYGDFHFRLAKAAVTNQRKVVLAARDHIKSTIMSQLFPLWRAAYQHRDLKERILLMSDTGKQAKKNLEHIDILIEHAPWLSHLRPHRPKTWTKTELYMSNGSKIEVVGFGSPVRGGHYHLVVLDDIIGDTQRHSFEFMLKFIRRAVIPMVKKGSQFFFVGTPQHEMDPIMVFYNMKIYNGEIFPAVQNWDNKEVLWPEHWDFDSLMERKEEVGTLAFAQEYQCEPIDDSSSMFPMDVLTENYAGKLSLTERYDGAFPVYIGVDIAKSGRVGADWWVAIAIEVDEAENRRILSIEREKGLTLPKQLDKLESLGERFKPRFIVVEANALQSFVTDEALRTTALPIIPHTTGKEKANLEEGVPSLVVLFENKKYRIPRRTERDRILTDVLVNELNHFGWEGATVKGKGAHDDTVMALWLAELAMRGRRRKVRRAILR